MLQKASAYVFFFSFLINFSSAVNAGQYSLAPTVDLQLEPVQVYVPEKFSFLGDDLVFELPPGFEARIFAPAWRDRASWPGAPKGCCT